VDRRARICILGAGAGGLSAAWYLRQRGFSEITMVERNPEVGGKCRSWTADGALCELGAIGVFPCYTRVHAFLERYGMKVEPVPSYQLVQADGDASAPLSQVYRGLSLPSQLGFFLDLQRYRSLRRSLAPHLDGPDGLVDIREAGLHERFDLFLREHDLQRLERMFHICVTNYGYGFLDEIPAAYALKYLSVPMLDAFVNHGMGQADQIGWLPRLGYQGLMRAIADDLPTVRFRKGAETARIERTAAAVRLALPNQVLAFDLLIVTTSDLRNLESVLDLNDEERAVLSRVRFNNYATVLLEASGIGPGGYGCNLAPDRTVGPPPDGGVVQMLRPYPDRDLLVCYCYARDASVTLDRFIARCERTVHARGGRMVRVVEACAWRYFPHFDSDALSLGFAARLRALAGRGIRFAGSLHGFETVESVLAVSERLAEEIAAGPG
jgi:predicted NAD/FAD-binding protein